MTPNDIQLLKYTILKIMMNTHYAKYVLALGFIIFIYTVLPNMKKTTLYFWKEDFSDLNGKDIKYILQWTPRSIAPFDILYKGRRSFTENSCQYTNCFVTDDREYLNSITEFHAIMFNGRDVIDLTGKDLPPVRDARQKYIFAATESAHNYPACNDMLDGYFNWTWTYRLDSDFRWGYITIYDLNGTVIGPAVDMRWSKLDPFDERLKTKLEDKRKAAAWFVSNCRSLSNREPFAHKVKMELMKYGWDLDIFGECGRMKCPRNTAERCFKMLEMDYFFYLSFENSFSEDYVTEKLLIALNNYAVPVVYGGANYSRFLPPGSYLNARELGEKKLAENMVKIMRNQSLYFEFHRWRNHFVYKETLGTVDLCKLCEMLNNEEKMSEISVYDNFRHWWNGKPLVEACTKNRNNL